MHEGASHRHPNLLPACRSHIGSYSTTIFRSVVQMLSPLTSVPVLNRVYLISDPKSGANVCGLGGNRRPRGSLVSECDRARAVCILVTDSLSSSHSYLVFCLTGKVGDWKTLFTVLQNERFEEDYRRQMDGCSITFQDPK